MTKFQAAGARVAVAIALSGAISAPALAANSLSGVLYTETHALAAGAAVTLTGNNVTLRQIADSSGRFTFGALGVGSYEILAETKTGAARARIDLGTSDASVKLTLLHTVALVKTSTLPPVHGSGTDLTMNQQFLARSPASRDFPSLLLQIPGAARGANGVVHINGDHGDINYIVDGVPIPQELNRSVGSEFDPADVSFVEVLQGAYPARYGERFASVVNISTRVGNGAPGFSGYTSAVRTPPSIRALATMGRLPEAPSSSISVPIVTIVFSTHPISIRRTTKALTPMGFSVSQKRMATTTGISP